MNSRPGGSLFSAFLSIALTGNDCIAVEHFRSESSDATVIFAVHSASSAFSCSHEVVGATGFARLTPQTLAGSYSNVQAAMRLKDLLATYDVDDIDCWTREDEILHRGNRRLNGAAERRMIVEDSIAYAYA